MNNNAKNRNQDNWPEEDMNNKHHNKELINNIQNGPLPYEDPAVTNPEELASFPKISEITDAKEVANESESHLVNKRTPVREGRNIIRTDNNPDTDGFM
jgi:hypothetical protein